MKSKLKTVFSVLVVTTATVFSSCDSPAQKVEGKQDNVTEAKENLDKAQDDYAAEVAKFKKESHERMEANDKTIAEYKSRMKEEKSEAKEEYNKKIASLEQKNSDMKKRMNEYKEDGKDKWQTFKREFSRDMEELGNSFKDFGVDNKK